MKNLKFKLGQKVLVNTGGLDTVGIIDKPTIINLTGGYERPYYMGINTDDRSFLVRFTDDINKTRFGGAERFYDNPKAINYLCESAQFIPEKYIRTI